MDVLGQTSLHVFARYTNDCSETIPEIGQILVRMGAEIEQRDDRRRTPLLHAVAYNNDCAFRVLYHLGARLDSTDEVGRTVLHIAALYGTLELFDARWGAVSDLHVDPDLENKRGHTAIDELEWRIGLGKLSEEDRIREQVFYASQDLLKDEIKSFYALIDEIRGRHNFPEGRSSRNEDSVKITIPGGWSTDEEETDQGNGKIKEEPRSASHAEESDGDKGYYTVPES